MKKNSEWAAKIFNDPKFQEHYAQETFIEDFLLFIDEEMKRKNISRTELSEKMNVSPSYLTRVMQRTRKLSAETIVSLAFHLRLTAKITIEDRHDS